jgi:iron complex outermembrane receptor protein
MPAWEAFEAERPPSSNRSVSPPVSFCLKQGETMLDTATAIAANPLNQPRAGDAACFARRFAGVGPAEVSGAGRYLLVTVLMAACGLAIPVLAVAQSSTPQTASSSQTQDSTKTDTAKPATQQIAPVTTTVVVHGETRDNYLPDAVTVGTLDGATLTETPLSAMVMTRDLLNDQVSRLLSDVVKNDASVGDDYVPVGYYGVYEIRGFAIDLATGLEVNGMTIAGEQDVPLENKERVEILKGIAGVESGVAGAGGLIDYVTKRPAAIKALDLATDHRGSAYGAVDLGRLFGSRKQVGARVNLAGERIASYMNDTNGWRAVGAGAADWKLSSKAILKGDFEYQHKTERDGSGYQLLGGTTLPDINKVYPSTMLGDQPWGPPDTYDTFNTGARLDYNLPRNWLAFAAGSLSHSLIQDNVIYAYGCYYETECNSGSAPYPWFFAPDGTYDIYDYRDPGELRIDAQAEAMVTGHIKTGAAFRRTSLREASYFCAVCNSQERRLRMRTPHCAGWRGVHIFGLGEHLPAQCSVPIESPLQSAGPRALWRTTINRQPVMQDRIHLAWAHSTARRRAF